MVEVNYLAVLACGIASMILGFIWYGPLFGKAWIRMMGWDPNNTQQMAELKKGAAQGYFISFIGSLVMAYVLSHMLTFAMSYMETSGVSAGLSVGFWVWLGFIAPITLGSVLWEGKSWKLWTFNNAYNLIQALVFGMILAVWQ